MAAKYDLFKTGDPNKFSVKNKASGSWCGHIVRNEKDQVWVSENGRTFKTMEEAADANNEPKQQEG